MVFESFAEGLSFFLWSTFVIAVIMGAVVNKTNFCTMGAVSDMVNMGDYGRFRAWLLAIAVALLGVTGLEYLGMVEVNSTFPPYRNGPLVFGENILGGLLFGIGMTFASGCGNKTLIRIGGGNLKSVLVFIVIALIAWYMINPFPGSDKTLFSVLFYDWIRPISADLGSQQDIGAVISAENTAMIRLIAGSLIGLLLLVIIFRSADFRASKDNILGGLVVGLVILIAWYSSSNIVVNADDSLYSMSDYYSEWDMLAEDDTGKPERGSAVAAQSFTFINPIGQSYGFVQSGFDKTMISFGLISVIGVILGSLLWSLISRSFRIEWFVDMKDFFTHLVGAILMGFGGVIAMGCTIGQGITGVSTLAIGSIMTLFSIIFGSALTMKMQYYKLVYEDEASLFKALVTSLVDMKLLPASMRKLDAV
jgi:uncharacterized membrane protein YedE/YeeE